MDDIEKLICLLENGVPMARKEAAVLLGESKDERAIRALLEAMDDSYRNDVWGTAKDALASIGKMAMPALTDALMRKNRITGRPLIKLMARIGIDGEWFGKMALILREGSTPNDRAIAAAVLGATGNPDAILLLIATLSDKDIEARMAALEALANFEATAPALITALMSAHEDVRKESAEALWWMAEKCKTAGQVEEFGKTLCDGFSALVKSRRSDAHAIWAAHAIARARILVTNRKNSLASESKKDIFLEDIPRPPKGSGKIYQSARMVRDG
jgi:hypothetical protein